MEHKYFQIIHDSPGVYHLYSIEQDDQVWLGEFESLKSAQRVANHISHSFLGNKESAWIKGRDREADTWTSSKR